MSPVRPSLRIPRLATIAVLPATVLLCVSVPGVQAAVTGTAVTGSTLYVSPSGSDSNDGSVSSPLKTPQTAVDKLGSAGGTVRFAGGTYAKQRIVLSGRSNITLQAASGATPVLDETGLSPVSGSTGVVEIRDSKNITVQGLGITGYRTKSTSSQPIGIYVVGTGDSITLQDNHVHHLGNDNTTKGSFDINAHGIAAYGTSATTSITNLKIAGNELDHLVLGASESLVVNGNVNGWSITGNTIHDNNNIGIDAIGYEPTISGSARYTDVNSARNGVISNNKVSKIISQGNPAYYDNGGYCNCADGIYVDGGTTITISDNAVDSSDIGIEVASEWPKGKTRDITVTGNTVTSSRYTGLAIGGYDTGRGEAYGIKVTGNTLRSNNTLNDGSGEVILQYFVHDSQITDNTIAATNSGAVLISRVKPSGSSSKNANLTLDRNHYEGKAASGKETYAWNGSTQTGLAAYRKASGQEGAGTYTQASSFRRPPPGTGRG